MFGDLVLKINEKWKQFWCIHDYKTDNIGWVTGLHMGFVCKKCGKLD